MVGGKFEIITRLLEPPVLVMRGALPAMTGVGTEAPPIVGMLLKLELLIEGRGGG